MARQFGGRRLPALLAAVVLVSAALVFLGERRPGSADGGRVGTAVLSWRRAPGALVQLIGDARLRRAFHAALTDGALGQARDQSCLVVHESGRVVYHHQPALPLAPASNLKVLTAVAVLKEFDPRDRLRTEVRAVRSGPAVEGDLWLVGGGDPLLATADYAASLERQPQLRTPLEELADALVSSGVREVRGRVVGDETRYDRERYVPTWKSSYREDGDVGPASALTVNDNFVRWEPKPVGAAAPATNAAAVFTSLLQARGVVVAGPPGEGTAPAVPVVAAIASPPIAEVVAQMLRESDNLTAELLGKELGVRRKGQGTRLAGLDAMRAALAEAGLQVSELTTADASGLDRSDRLTCGLVVDALERAGEESSLAKALPLAARDGTLFDRFLGHPAAGKLRAKTGSLTGVASLAGFAPTRSGTTLVFALVANGLPRDALGRRLQEQVGDLLVEYPQAPARADLGPKVAAQ